MRATIYTLSELQQMKAQFQAGKPLDFLLDFKAGSYGRVAKIPMGHFTVSALAQDDDTHELLLTRGKDAFHIRGFNSPAGIKHVEAGELFDALIKVANYSIQLGARGVPTCEARGTSLQPR